MIDVLYALSFSDYDNVDRLWGHWKDISVLREDLKDISVLREDLKDIFTDFWGKGTVACIDTIDCKTAEIISSEKVTYGQIL